MTEYVVRRDEMGVGRMVGVRRAVTFGETNLPEVISAAYDEVYGALGEGAAVGQNVIVYVPDGDRTAAMIVGCELLGEAPDGLEVVELPAGPVASTQHQGCYGGLPAAHQAIHRWMHDRGHREVGTNWERYGDWSDDEDELLTDVFYALPG